ncbi:MAG: aminotransferase class I/II-fold pyridoxal phosphate-dependent enzyme, partial [Planctomycetota bacterium]
MTRFRPIVSRITGYVPGEQPQRGGWIKLNTNENPYPPSPRVREAIAAAARGRLNVYPDPLATPLREAIGRVFGLDPDWILPGNGSDEVLTIIMRTFVDAGETVALPYPSYVLYETLAELQGARSVRIPLNSDWSWNLPAAAARLRHCRVLFVPNPNSPSGTLWPPDVLERLLPPHGVLVIDQAYADFCDTPAGLPMIDSSHRKRVIITRTLSKSYSLAGIRCGFAIADPDLIA